MERAHVKRLLLVQLLLLSLSAGFIAPAACLAPLEGLGGVATVKGLKAVMYPSTVGWGGAYRLLNASGAVGSQGDQNELLFIDAPLAHHDQLAPGGPTGDVVVLLPVRRSVPFFKALLSDAALQRRVKGVLLDDTDAPDSYSCAGPFPGGAEYAPYHDAAAAAGYVWNAAAGSNAFPSAFTWLPAPTFLLTPAMAAAAAARAAFNAARAPQQQQQQQYHARLKLPMTAGSAANSSACLAAGTCKPLGGYSVWAALPPLPAAAGPGSAGHGAHGSSSSSSSSSALDGRPIVLVVAQMDGLDMFHDAVQGANAPLSGLLAMLAAVQQLQQAAAAGSYNRRLVFLALAGEPWGYMGSRRLLYEAASGSNATAGLDMRLVQQVVELGAIGRLQPGADDGVLTLVAHRQRGAAFGDASGALAALSAAAQHEAAAARLAIREASASNPGIPPSSLMSFLRVNASTAGLVLAEFDSGFTDPFFGSRFDNGSSRVSTDAISRVSAVLAAALHRLAGGDPARMQVDMSRARDAVSALAPCLLDAAPGFGCPLAQALMAPDYMYSPLDGSRSCALRGYVGVLPYLPDVQGPLGKANLARFLWNFLANATASSSSSSSGQAGGGAGEGSGVACDPFATPCAAPGDVCVGWRRSGKDAAFLGRCRRASVRYVPSYSTALACSACADPWSVAWAPSAAADAWSAAHGWPADPAWAESDWPLGVPDLQLYLREAPRFEAALLAAGSLVTAAVGVATWLGRRALAARGFN